MTKRYCPEFLAFQRNYVVLLNNLRHGIESITSEAFAAELISTDLRIKCSDKTLGEAERTKCLLDALEQKMPYLPETLHKFAKILNQISCFEFIAEKLLISLEEAKKELKMMEKRSLSFSNTMSTSTSQQGTSKLLSLDEARSPSTQKKGENCIYSTPAAAILPGNSSLITGATFLRATSFPGKTLNIFPGNSTMTAGDRDASPLIARRLSGLKLSFPVLPFNKQEEGRGFTVTTPPATPTQRPVLERRYNPILTSP